ncbi:hypothetical protein EC957_000529, partial [Mortierella hygrophila]
DEQEESENEENDVLGQLLNAIFFPQHQLKRQQSNHQQYPSKRHNHELEKQKQVAAEEQAKKQKQIEQAKAAAEAKKQQRASESDDEDVIGNYFLTFPDIKSMVEAALGAKVEVSAKKPATPTKSTAFASAPTKVAESKLAVEAKTASTPSSTHSSPELRAADILQQRQHRQREHDISVEEKHTTLNQIDAVLDALSHELDDIVAGRVENKKQILQTEENLTKAMFRIDSVESGGEVSVRHRRKELIKKSQTLLDVVDEFKTRGTTSDATPTITATAETEASSAVENDVEMTESAPEASPETESTEIPAVETTVTTDSTEEEHDETEETELLETLSDI